MKNRRSSGQRILGIVFAVAALAGAAAFLVRLSRDDLGWLTGLRGGAMIGLFATEASRRLLLRGPAARRAETVSGVFAVVWVALLIIGLF